MHKMVAKYVEIHILCPGLEDPKYMKLKCS